MTPPEYGIWLILGTVTLMALTAVFFPVRGGHGQHAHAGPGTLTVDYLRSEPHDDIVWPPEPETHVDPEWPEPEPTPLERNLARLCAAPDGEYIGRHRLNEEYELYEPPPGWCIELDDTPHLVGART